jgi:hypothetical protein
MKPLIEPSCSSRWCRPRRRTPCARPQSSPACRRPWYRYRPPASFSSHRPSTRRVPAPCLQPPGPRASARKPPRQPPSQAAAPPAAQPGPRAAPRPDATPRLLPLFRVAVGQLMSAPAASLCSHRTAHLHRLLQPPVPRAPCPVAPAPPDPSYWQRAPFWTALLATRSAAPLLPVLSPPPPIPWRHPRCTELSLARRSCDCACPPPQRPAHSGYVRVLRSSLEPYSPGLRRDPPSGGPSRAWTACLPMCCDCLPSG